MAFRELTLIEVQEVLRQWTAGRSIRAISEGVGLDRKTVRRYINEAKKSGLNQSSETGISEAMLGQIIGAIQPGGRAKPGQAREDCRRHHALIEGWVKDDVKGPKIVRLLERHAKVKVPLRTLQRYLSEEVSPPETTVRVAPSPSGEVLEVDFGELGRLRIPNGRGPKVYALICTPARSRYTFVWPSLDMSFTTVLEGLEAAWAFYGGVFRVLLPDNMKAIVQKAHPLSPKIQANFLEYSQSRGFHIDTARVRHPKDKPHVERNVPFVRNDFFGGEEFLSLEEVREAALHWCREHSGMRIHGTTRRRPREEFESEEKPHLLSPPSEPYDQPTWSTMRVARDSTIPAGYALYSVPGGHLGESVRVRTDRATVKIYHRGTLLRVHGKVEPGKTSFDPADIPEEKAGAALRNGEALLEQAQGHGPWVAEYVRQLLAGPLPWTRVRHVYRLLGLCRRHGDTLVAAACKAALDLEVIDVQRIAGMIERDGAPVPPPTHAPQGGVVLRFARSPNEYRRIQGDSDARP